MMCQLKKTKERKRRKLALAHAYAYDVRENLHGVVVETSDSSKEDDDEDNYATPELQGDSESEAKDDVAETQVEGSDDGIAEILLLETNRHPEGVGLQTKEDFPIQSSPRSRSRPFQLFYDGQKATHFEFIDNERLRRRFMEAADPRKRETVLMSWIDENEETRTNIRNGDYPRGVLQDVSRRMRGERTLATDPTETCTRGQLLMLRMRVGEPESKIKANEIRDSIYPLFFISTEPAKTDKAMATSKETQTTIEEGHVDFVDHKLDQSDDFEHECGSKRKILKTVAIVAAAAALVVIVVCVVTVAWHGNRL